MKISAQPYGVTPDGKQTKLYILENKNGVRAEITDLGGCLLRLYVPDKDGKLADVVLAHPSMEDYIKNPNFFGALVGRSANRIGGAEVDISGTVYQLDKNNGENNLHGGYNSLTFQVMSSEARIVEGCPLLLLSHTFEHMSDGFPGTLSIQVCYSLTDDNALTIDYRAVADKDTVINLTNHSYFNLAGHDSGSIDNHTLQINANFYNPGGEDCLPTGEILSVEGTVFDFTKPRTVGEGLSADVQQLKQFGGYDHNLVLDGQGYRKIATLTDPASGRAMDVSTNLPAVQLYTGNNVKDCPGKDNTTYAAHHGLCLETQFIPNAVHMPWLLSPIFSAGDEFVSTTSYRFYNV